MSVDTIARSSQIIAVCFHPTKHISICIIGMDHQITLHPLIR